MGENAYPKHGLRGTRYLIVHNTLYRKQEGKCAICGYRVGEVWVFGNKVHKLVIDHSHTTGKIRGLLCNGCNTQVGNYERGLHHLVMKEDGPVDDYVAKIEAYLEGWNERYRTFRHH